MRLVQTLSRAALGGVAAAALIGAGSAAAEPAMWVVKDRDSTVYLFGTVHLLRPDVVWRTPTVERAMAESTETWLELSEIGASDPGLQARVKALTEDPSRPLSSRLNETQRAALAKAAADLGVPVAALEPMKPWWAAIQLSLVAMMKAGYQPGAGVDVLVRRQADKEGDEVRGLETLEQQLTFFDGLPEAQQIELLMQAAEDAAEGVAVLDRIVAAYASGDPDAIGRAMNDELRAEAPKLYDILLTRRNKDWAAQIETMMKGSGTHFVAVGAGHLAGPDSVQVQLKKRGLKAERVK